MNARLLKSSLCCAAGALALAGCGSSSSSSTSSTTATTATTPAATTPAAPSGTSKLTLQADPTDSLMFNQSSLTASAGTVTIDFENQSPVPHNVTVADSTGKVLGQTPDLHGREQDADAQAGEGDLHVLLLGPRATEQPG